MRQSNGYSERVRWFQYVAAAILKIAILYYALQLWGSGKITVAEFVVACTTALLIINEARNLSRRFLEFFEYVGNVANGVHIIIKPHEIVDAPRGGRGAHRARAHRIPTRGRLAIPRSSLFSGT